ncbi:kinase-like domain-containing protein [Parachaetomium inaequale]|uniref:Kinase-like domain-containing protein n=1 Tax=Parachaetomium inaequale TaxID=2588326 RepID=A0AAN6SRF4_9PEZI|nr:kinase-like domain-containing protein [Parachaetomium inaequale]
MASRPTLPYFAPADRLPGPLPTVAEILASKESSVSAAHFAVKYGEPRDGVHLQEGENMLFVQQPSRVPVPTVYAIFHDEGTNKNFIVQEYIPGKLLERVWGGLTSAEKTGIASQLRRHLDELRSIPSPGYYGGIWRQPNLDGYFQDPELDPLPHRDESISKPQETEEQWVDAMWRCVGAKHPNERQNFLSLLRRQYHTIFRGHRPVFTHNDFSPVNIMARDDTKALVIIDWEKSGWYPSFWEYCNAIMLLRR